MAHWYRSGDTHSLIYSDTPGVTNIKGHSVDNTNKGARTLSYGPVRVVSYLSYCTYSQHSPSNRCNPHFRDMLCVFGAWQRLSQYICGLFRIAAAFEINDIILNHLLYPMPMKIDMFGALVQL